MNLYEKLNRLDDSLVESTTIVKKPKLTENRLTTTLKRRSFLKDVFDKYEILDLAEAHDDFKRHSYSAALNYVLRNWDNYYLEDEFVAWLEEQEDYEDNYDDDIDEMLTEDFNSVSSQIPEDVDAFLQDLAQIYGMFDYKDIMKHEYTEEEIKKLRNYERRFNAEIEYEGDEEADAIMNDVAEKVAKVIKPNTLKEGNINSPFANNIDKDILTALNTSNPELVTSNFIKCSKSVVPNALYYVEQGEDVEFILGNIELPQKQITHCWITHNGDVLQTGAFKPDSKLITKFTTKLTPNDVEKSKKQISDLILSI